ncbi:MAG: hypothetical protein Q8P93_01225 [bacterium]|nr:hypothetical protein [bacterium]
MTTITIKQQLKLKKRHFNDLTELRAFIDNEIEGADIDFRPLKKSEVTPALLKKMKEAKKLPASKFTNLTAEYAHR